MNYYKRNYWVRVKSCVPKDIVTGYGLKRNKTYLGHEFACEDGNFIGIRGIAVPLGYFVEVSPKGHSVRYKCPRCGQWYNALRTVTLGPVRRIQRTDSLCQDCIDDILTGGSSAWRVK